MSEIGVSARENLLKPIATNYRADWMKLSFWRNAFLLYWIFSLIGHVLEFGWAALGMIFNAPGIPQINTIPIFAIAAPYGLGALALIWTVYPSVSRGRVGAIRAYFLSVAVTTAIEFICAALIVMFIGHNPFWDYGDQPFNLFGFVCLRNALAFGIAAIPMLYWGFPLVNNWLNKIKARHLNIACIVLLVSYIAVQVWRIF